MDMAEADNVQGAQKPFNPANEYLDSSRNIPCNNSLPS